MADERERPGDIDPDAATPADRDDSLLRSAERLLEKVPAGAEPVELPTRGALAGEVGERLVAEVDADLEAKPGALVGEFVGRVRLEEMVGRGGMGEVYRGRDQVLDRLVAVKRIRPGRRLGAEAKERFFREARVLSRLDHPNICQLYDLTETPDGEFMLLEFIDGERLSDRIASGLEEHEALPIAEQVAAALVAAHSDDIVHRDLKPDNVMIAPEGRAKVLDFGIARSGADSSETVESSPEVAESEAGLTSVGQVLGTARYMSPEQKRGEPVGPPTDLWALGMLLHEMFTGEAPAGDVGATEGMDRSVAALAERLLQDDPSARGTAREAREAIRALMERGDRRRRLITRAAMGLVGLTAVGALFWFSRPEGDAFVLEPGQQGRVAIAPFVNATGDEAYDWVEQGLPTMVVEALDGLDGVDTIAWSVAHDALRLDRDPQASGPGIFEMPPERARQIGAAVGAEMVVLTRVSRVEDGFRFEYRSHNVLGRSGERTLAASELVGGAERLAAGIARQIGAREELVGFTSRFSEDPFVNRLYATGRHRFATEAKGEGAVLLFRTALEIDPDFHWARLALAECLDWMGRRNESRQEFDAVLAIADDAGDRALRAAALRGLGIMLVEDDRDYALAPEVLEEALALERQMGNDHRVADLLRQLGWAYSVLSDEAVPGAAEQGRVYDDEAYELMRNFDDPLSRVRAHYMKARAERDGGDPERAVIEAQRTIELAADGGFVVLEALANMVLGGVLWNRGEPRASLDAQYRAVELNRSIDNWIGMATATINAAVGHMDLGEHTQAEAGFREAIRIADEHGLPGRSSLATWHLGRCLIAQGRHEESLEVLARVVDRYSDRAAFNLTLASAYEGLSDWEQATEALGRAKGLDPNWNDEKESRLTAARSRAR